MAITAERRERILNDVAESWRTLLETVDSLDESDLHAPGRIGEWSVKDVLGHIATWDRVAIQRIRLAERGERRRLVPNLHRFNHEQAEAAREKSVDDVRADMESTHRELVQLLESTPVLTRDLIRADTYDHYRGHVDDIRAAMAGSREADD
jgi:uncharacterized damage-inducible protein DinB